MIVRETRKQAQNLKKKPPKLNECTFIMYLKKKKKEICAWHLFFATDC